MPNNVLRVENVTMQFGGVVAVNNLSMNVNGIGISAQIELFISPGSNYAQATVYPNFNSNTVWIQGTVVPYDSSNVFEGSSL